MTTTVYILFVEINLHRGGQMELPAYILFDAKSRFTDVYYINDLQSARSYFYNIAVKKWCFEKIVIW